MVFSPLEYGIMIGVEAPVDFDVEERRKRLKKELEETRKYLSQNVQRQNNPVFQAKASEDSQIDTAAKVGVLSDREESLVEELKRLESWRG
jgi:valyl-tRNA synthetase